MRVLTISLVLALVGAGCGRRTCATSDDPRYEAMEDRALTALATVVTDLITKTDWSQEAACETVSDYKVQILPVLEFEMNGSMEQGYVHCPSKRIWVAEYGGIGFQCILTHELAHAVEKCADPKHTTWRHRRIYDAIVASELAAFK